VHLADKPLANIGEENVTGTLSRE